MKTAFPLKRLVLLAMFAAISVALMFLIRIPMFLPFLEYDPADITVFLCSILLGPYWALLLSFVVSVLQGLTVSIQSGIIGIVMHFIATGCSAFVCGCIYKIKKNFVSAVFGIIAGTLIAASLMALMNYLLVPIFSDGMTSADVAPLLLPVFIPFNLIKFGIKGTVAALIYKPISILAVKTQLL